MNYTYPEPLPPTIATFFPVGTVKLNSSKIGFPSTYPKVTFSNTIAAEHDGTMRLGAFGFS